MLYKRSSKPGAHWWVRFEVKGVEVRQSSGTDRKERAEAFEQSLRDAIWDEENLGIEVHTWEEAIDRWYREKAHKRSLARDRQAFVRLVLSGEIGPKDLDGSIGARERAVYRSLLNACVKWGWLNQAQKVTVPRAKTLDPRSISEAQEKALLKELPPHAAQLARFALATGLRRGNIFRLKWEAVDLKRRVLFVGSRDAKSGKSGGFPLNPDAMRVLKQQSKVHPMFVFADHAGRAPIGSIKTTWLKAVKRAGLGALRFHDLRHTWATRHTMRGTPPVVLKTLGGWSSLAMVEKYSNMYPGHLADWAGNSSTKTGTSQKRQKRKRLK